MSISHCFYCRRWTVTISTKSIFPTAEPVLKSWIVAIIAGTAFEATFIPAIIRSFDPITYVICFDDKRLNLI